MYYSTILQNSNNYIEPISNENIWIDDNTVMSCYHCKKQFSFFTRKHHCRACGKIFCYNCSNFYIYTNVQSELINIQKYLDESISDTSTKTINKRLCVKCNTLFLKINYISKLIKILQLLPMDLFEFYKCFSVSKVWNSSIRFYLNKFRGFQYNTIYTNLLKTDYNILRYNYYNICGHNKLISLYIINHNWDIYDKNFIYTQLNLLQKKTTKCLHLLCNNTCKNKLTTFDILYILNTAKNKYVKHYLLTLLSNNNDIHFEVYLPLFINFIKNDNLNDFSITDFIIKHIQLNPSLLFELFLQLFIIVKNTTNTIFQISLQKIKDNISKDIYKKAKISFDFIKKITNIQSDNIENSVNNINQFLLNNSVYLPFKKDIKIVEISKNYIIKDSNSKPIIFEFIYEDDTTQKIMYKREDLRKDYIIHKIIQLMKIILNKNHISNNTLIYKILPINTQSGLIEIVPDSITLYDINLKHNYTLQNYILDKNINKTIESVKYNFISSLAIYSVITYCLGIGDRHLDNIMITNNGTLFHIDFSFCLGNDPKLMKPSIRLTQEMIDMIGGIQSDSYKQFLNLCNLYYNTIRKHTTIISIFIQLLVNIDNSFNIDTLKKEIINRFIYKETDHYASNSFNNTVENSFSNYSFIDFIHYHSKERTVTKTVFNLYDNTISLPYYIKNIFTNFQ